MIRFLKRYPLLCLIATLAACSDDPADHNGEGLPAGCSRIELFLSAGQQPSTRAPWDDANATDEEMMRTALVIMAKDNTVERIIPVNMGGSWCERHSVGTITTENGDYTFYSFANIDYSGPTTNTDGKYTTTLNGLTFTEGSALPEGLETSAWTADFNNYAIDPDKGIPMTNKEVYPVNNSLSVTLRVFRLLSKLSFEFTNKSEEAVTIQRIELGQVTPNGTDIYFLPPKEGENIVNRFPTAFENGSLTVTDEATPITLPEASTGATAKSKTVYLNESESQHPTRQMPLTVTITRGDADTTETKYALMSLTNIPRNSYVVVPVSITDYMLELKAFFYAPIGGYPPYTIENKKNDFYCTFSCGGDFILQPFIYKYEDHLNTENWFELNDDTRVDGQTLTVSDPDNIFSTEPYVSSDGEIIGTLNGTKGTASVRLTVRLKTDTPGVLQELNRTLYIIV